MERHVRTNQTLCNVCEKVDLRQLHAKLVDEDKDGKIERRLEPRDNDLGYVDEIVQMKDCALCRLVTKVLRMSWTAIPLHTRHGERIRCFIPTDFKDAMKTKILKRRNWELEVSLDVYGKDLGPSQEKIHSSTIRLADSDTHRVTGEGGVFALGRIYDAACCDLDFIVKSYRNCVDSHGPACDMSVHLRQKFAPFREVLQEVTQKSGLMSKALHFIDVQDCCIKPSSGDCRWLALSYVWGKANFIRLTKSNYDALTTPGYLKHVRLPRTIQESMELVSKLSERYLWVDSMCIIQDDEENKMAQIKNMGTIYNSAALTIVAASGDDVEAGLAGLYPGSRLAQQCFENVQGLRLLAMGPPLESVLCGVKWDSRAWTYQELVMSKRILFFTPQQVFFFCAAEPVSEDSVHYDLNYNKWYKGNSDLMDPAALLRDPYFSNWPWKNFDEIKNRALLDERAFGDNQFPEAYKKLVRNYSRRSLTYTEDILNAISGIFRSVAIFRLHNFVYGLPESYFDWALLWQPMGPLHRRSGATASGQMFPSWSWTGWVGPVGYTNFEDRCIRPEVRRWAIQTSQGKPEKYELLVGSESNSVDECYMFNHQKNTCFNEPRMSFDILCFSTRSARFKVDGHHDSEKGTLVAGDLLSLRTKSLGIFRIMNRDDWIGGIVLELEFAKTLRDAKIDAEFIVLSKSIGYWHIGAYDADTGYRKNVNMYDDIKLDPHRGRQEGRNYRCLMYNVMWIRREGSVAYRVAIGQIHIDAWETADWKEEGIRIG